MHLFIVSYLLFIMMYDILCIGVDIMNDKLCPKMEESLKLFGKKWIGLIVFSLLDGEKKFSDIEKFIPGLSGRVLTERLKELELKGIINRNVVPSRPIKISYELTRKGIDLSNVFNSIGEWTEKWM